jgi:hypothetical protein
MRIAPSATPQEAAAIVAALDQFIAETTSPAPPAASATSGWLLNARLEAVGVEPDTPVFGGARSAWGLQTS